MHCEETYYMANLSSIKSDKCKQHPGGTFDMGSVAARVVSGGNFRPLRRNLDDELIYILQVSGRLN